MNDSLFQKLRELISTEWGVDKAEITPEAHLQGDLNSDPLSVSDLMIKIEEEFDIKVPENHSVEFDTVNDILDFISEQQGEI